MPAGNNRLQSSNREQAMKAQHHFFYAGLLAASLQSWSTSAAEVNNVPAVRVIDLFNAEAARPVKVHLWYPEGRCAEAQKPCLDAGARKNEVIVLSHGAMGSADLYNWLGQGLAAAGWVVAGISHYGESRAYGDAAVDPASVLRAWQRPEDIGFMLDEFASNDPFESGLDWRHVTMIGHSSGGQTAAALAGVRLNAAQLLAYCASAEAEADLGCGYGQRAQPTPDALDADLIAANYEDERIEAIVMLDPALGPAATVESMREVDVPVLIIAAQENDFLPFAAHAEHYAAYIPNAKLVALDNGEGHFVFLDECGHAVEVQGLSLCRDRTGVDRRKTQSTMLETILGFITEV